MPYLPVGRYVQSTICTQKYGRGIPFLSLVEDNSRMLRWPLSQKVQVFLLEKKIVDRPITFAAEPQLAFFQQICVVKH